MLRAIDEAFADARIRSAFRFIAENEDEIESDQLRITLVAAPPFQEAERARFFAEELSRIGLVPASDEIGNVIAPYAQMGSNPVVVAAHLDTVFPASTPLELRRNGRIIHLPGISDNGAGLVAVLWMLRAARDAGLRFRRPVIAIGNVGEEGEGNLRGVRHLFKSPPWGDRRCEFIAVDGGGMQRITNQALGSRRFRIRMNGPGGHSWADSGRPNPLHGLAAAVHRFTSTAPLRRGVTAFNVGVFRSGISVNAIPSEAIAEVDIRSVATSDLDDLEARLRASVQETAAESGVRVQVEPMGERPAGVTASDLPIVQTALEATKRFGGAPQLDVGSTDANIPMSLGLPAIAIGGGGTCGGVHTADEWFDPSLRRLGVQRLLAVVAVLAGLD